MKKIILATALLASVVMTAPVMASSFGECYEIGMEMDGVFQMRHSGKTKADLISEYYSISPAKKAVIDYVYTLPLETNSDVVESMAEFFASGATLGCEVFESQINNAN